MISFGDRLENTTSVSTGAASGSILLTTAGSVSRGKRTVATLSRTSCVAASISRSRVKVIVQLPLPWLELQRSSSMPLIVLTAASIGLVMEVSTSSALAPFGLARTLTVGESVRGIRSSPRSRYENQPRTRSAALIIKKEDGRVPSGRRVRRDSR